MAAHDDSTATILFALGANAVIALAKGSVAWITGSASMVAEAVQEQGRALERLGGYNLQRGKLALQVITGGDGSRGTGRGNVSRRTQGSIAQPHQ